MKLTSGIDIVTALLLSVGLGCSLHAQENDPLYPARAIFVQLTSKIPTPDSVQIDVISKVDVIAMNSEVTVRSTKLLPAEKVSPFLHLWRSQHWLYRDHSAVDDPYYRIRFYRQNSLLLEATLMRSPGLWDVRFLRSDLKTKLPAPSEAMFDSTTDVGKALRSFLEEAIP